MQRRDQRRTVGWWPAAHRPPSRSIGSLLRHRIIDSLRFGRGGQPPASQRVIEQEMRIGPSVETVVPLGLRPTTVSAPPGSSASISRRGMLRPFRNRRGDRSIPQ